MTTGWKFLGEGTYNKAYKSADGKLVLKIQKKQGETDSPERSVRLWNAINQELEPKAFLTTERGYYGWVCPFIEGEQASDNEMREALINIFNHTGRIILDATANKNFVKTPPPNSKVVCVDIGMAMQMERNEDRVFAEEIRRKSTVSLEAWHNLNHAYDKFFQESQKIYPKTVEITKALLFIKDNRPDISDVTFLKNNPELVKTLARAYDYNYYHDYIKINKALDKLDSAVPVTLESVKDSLKLELQRYIDSRGKINKDGVFEPSFITRVFRDTILTNTKVMATKELIVAITRAESSEEINSILQKNATKELTAGKITRGFTATIGKCMAIIAATQNYLNLQLQGPDLNVGSNN